MRDRVKTYTFFIFIIFSLSSRAQVFKNFAHLSRPEKWWVIWHPFHACKAWKITAEARLAASEELKDSLLDGDANGGRVDAFRHAYWMARMAQSFSWRKAVRLGRAHEKGNYIAFRKGRADEEGALPDSVSGQMDLHNNEIGVTIGCNNKYLPADEIRKLVVQEILNGKMIIISKNHSGLPLDCNGMPVDPDEYHNKWSIPKCLIPSHF